MPVLPPKIRLFSVQHNGVFVFVSNDMAGPDHVVEAHPADATSSRLKTSGVAMSDCSTRQPGCSSSSPTTWKAPTT